MLRNNHLNKYRKKIGLLRSRIKYCTELKKQTKQFVLNLNNKYDSQLVTYNEYLKTLNETFNNKSPNDWINNYNKQIDECHRKISYYKEKLEKSSPIEIRGEYLVISIIILLSLGMFGLFQFGGITGLVTFTESVSNIDILNLTISEDTEFIWDLEYPRGINSILATGEIIGKGSAKIYLEHQGQLFLIYEKDNNESKFEFDSKCIETCVLPTLSSDSYKLIINVENSTLLLKSLSYFKFELFDIEIEPKENKLEFEPHLYKTYEVKVINKEKQNFNVAIFIEGSLNESITLYNHTLELNPEDEFKTFRYSIDLGKEVESNKNRARIIVKYLPDKEFTGSTPTEIHRIEIVNKETPIKENIINKWIVIIVLLVIITNIIWSLYLRKRKNN